MEYRDEIRAEPSVGFDYDAVEDHAGSLMEHTQADGCPVTRRQADSVLAWVAREGDSSTPQQARLAMRLLEWISGAQATRVRHTGEGVPTTSYAMGDMRLGIRAAIAIRELMPCSAIAGMSQEEMGVAFGVNRSIMSRMRTSFRRTFQK